MESHISLYNSKDVNILTYVLPLLLLLQVTGTTTSGDKIFSGSYKHQTIAAQDRGNSLWCYKCHTMDEKEECNDLAGKNNSVLVHKCLGDHRTCVVKRYSYTTSTENSTSVQRMWSIERNCVNKCEPGCITIGERTKLYACTSCCETSFCNSDRGLANCVVFDSHLVIMCLFLISFLQNMQSLSSQ
ncbi:uncharacterized protein LOC111048848 isoform X1 [Nilaparvata lugens]|uniref:uncharacterized protein LOC111048848 isoform X2 n=1 Tax=Nilaparvata lugens TaxID=108931 RepID=UPI00193E9E15|nr:uncharacterized protein LOC111048848 isoform X2 [Nilaparvata lugens]XP_039277522.1 uncharacterized protein LOC111048848 isoform X1 [Nilaparvata lugens]